MNAQIVSRDIDTFTIQISIPYPGRSMLEGEEGLQKRLNEAGVVATQELLDFFDTDGSPIMMARTKWTSKGKDFKFYESPYGEVGIERHVYQTSAGGATFCPLEKEARIILTATPKFAKMLSWKYSDAGSTRVIHDLRTNHNRVIARSYLQNVADAVGTVALVKEKNWEYALPELPRPVHSVSIGVDATCILMADGDYRQAEVGTISLYARDGERLHTVYAGATPEYGKETFFHRFDREISRIKEKCPKAVYIGVADGAKENWPYLENHTDIQVVDFYHATKYVHDAAGAMFPGKRKAQEKKFWVESTCHSLKHEDGMAETILGSMEEYKMANKMRGPAEKDLNSSISYFTNNKKRMKYAQNVEKNFPIGSGVTEAACKVIVKQRLCGSGMKWAKRGIAVVLALRCLQYSDTRWDQFWQKIDQYGYCLAA